MEKEPNAEQKILEAAETEFLAEGLSGARMQAIANRAGINKALLHYYFRSKDKLFEVVFNWKINHFLPQVIHFLQDDSTTFLDKMDQFVLHYMTFLRKNPSIPLFIMSTMNRNPELAKKIPTRVGAEIIQLMQREIERGTIRPVQPHQFLLSVLGMCLFPFVARPIFCSIADVSEADFEKLLAERHLHIMQYVRAILTI